VSAAADPIAAAKRLHLDGAKERAQNECARNAEALARCQGSGGAAVKYGDVVQLEHRTSQLFLALFKDPAPVNSSCRMVSLDHGSAACHFRVLPRFKVRSLGSPVYFDDDLVLQSVAFEPLVVGCSQRGKDLVWRADPDAAASLGVRLPAPLRHNNVYEVATRL
jgi:hypothetical protein